MGYNSKELKASPLEKKRNGNISFEGYKANSPDKNNAFNLIASNNITMQGVPHPILMIPMGGGSPVGNPVIGHPGENYFFPNHDMVLEFPLPQGADMHYQRLAYGGDPYPDQFARGGINTLKKLVRGQPAGHTNKNIQSSINKLMRRNEMLFGPAGKRYYKPFQDGGPNNQNPDQPQVAVQPAPSQQDQYLDALDQYTYYKQMADAEQQKNAQMSQTLLSNAQKKDVGNIPTRTDLGWINQGKFFCSSHTCELLRDSGYTVPQDIPGQQGSTLYKQGQGFPLIPGNTAFQENAPKLGFTKIGAEELQPGDVVQEMMKRSSDYQGNSLGSEQWAPAHSLIYAGKDPKTGENMYYNSPGGDRSNYAKTPLYGTAGKDYQIQGWHYTGKESEYQKKMMEYQNKMKEIGMPMMPMKDIQLVNSTSSQEPQEIQMPNWGAQFDRERQLINTSKMSKREKRKSLEELDTREQETLSLYGTPQDDNSTSNNKPMAKNKLKKGGNITNDIAFPQQPTAERFYERGWIPPGPVGFYKHGGDLTNDIAFPQQPPANIFFGAWPYQPQYQPGGAIQAGATAQGNQDAYNSYMNVFTGMDPKDLTAKLAELKIQMDNPTIYPQESLDVQKTVIMDILNPVKKMHGGSLPNGANGMPCMDCGGYMNDGGQHMMPDGTWMSDAMMKSGGWIQKATKNMRTDKPCTGSKFGGPDCPPGSKRYNLAKTFRAMAKNRAFGGDINDDMDQDDFLAEYQKTFKDKIKGNTAEAIADEVANEMYQKDFGGQSSYGYNPNNAMKQDMLSGRIDQLNDSAKQGMKGMFGATENLFATANPYMDYSMQKAQTGVQNNTPQNTAFTQDQFNSWMDAYGKSHQSNQNGYSTTPTYQTKYYPQSQGMQWFPVNRSPYMQWNTQGNNQGTSQNYGMPNVGFNPQNTYLQKFDYRGRMFGPGARKVSMTFRHYKDPVTGEIKQVPDNQPENPMLPTPTGYPNAPKQQMNPDYWGNQPNNLGAKQFGGSSMFPPMPQPMNDNPLQKQGAPAVESDYYDQPLDALNNIPAYMPSAAVQTSQPQMYSNPPTGGMLDPTQQIRNYNQNRMMMKYFGGPMAYGGYMPVAQFGIDAFGNPNPKFQGPLTTEYVQQNTPGYMQSQKEMDPMTGEYEDFTVTGKRKAGLNKHDTASWLLASAAGVTGMANRVEAKKMEEEMQRNTLADNSMMVAPANRIGSRGRWGQTGMGTGIMDYQNMNVIQQPGQNFSMEGQAFSQRGGPVELTEDEINNILANGGSIQYLD